MALIILVSDWTIGYKSFVADKDLFFHFYTTHKDRYWPLFCNVFTALTLQILMLDRLLSNMDNYRSLCSIVPKIIIYRLCVQLGQSHFPKCISTCLMCIMFFREFALLYILLPLSGSSGLLAINFTSADWVLNWS